MRVELVSLDSSTVQALGGDSWLNIEFVYRFVDGSQAYRCDSCQIQVAVRCKRRVVIVVECRAHLSVGR